MNPSPVDPTPGPPAVRTCLDAVRPDLVRRYSEPSRHYHNLAHIEACLRTFETQRHAFADPGAAELAIWFHDAVYDPTRSDNEELSARLAAELLAACNLPSARLRHIESLILATKHAAEPTDPDSRLLVDIDLAILGSPADEFDAYERAIRLEYAHVPGPAFSAGRSQILRRFLARPQIYLTEPFRRPYESAARANLARSLARLG